MFALRERLIGHPVHSHDPELHDYLRSVLVNAHEERLHAIFLDGRSLFLLGETLTNGEAESVTLRVRKLVHRALDLGSSKLILAHNHPSGSYLPSAQDRLGDRRLSEIVAALDIELVDHLIVSSLGIYSLREEAAL